MCPPPQSQTTHHSAGVCGAVLFQEGGLPRWLCLCFSNKTEHFFGCCSQPGLNFALVSKCQGASARGSAQDQSEQSAPGKRWGHREGREHVQCPVAICIGSAGGRRPGLWGGQQNRIISQAREEERRQGSRGRRVWGSNQLLYAILFKQDSYQRVILNFGLSYYLSSLGSGYVTFGFQKEGLNCLLAARAPNKRMRATVLGRGEIL